MNTPRLLLLLAVTGCTVTGLSAQSAISTRQSRQGVLERLRVLTQPATPSNVDYATLKDPYHPPAADLRDVRETPVATTTTVAQRSDAELLTVLSGLLKPTGSMTLGGEPLLLFGEKRQKKGDKLTLAHEGVEYVIEIVNIENNQFRIRYKNEELTRPVK